MIQVTKRDGRTEDLNLDKIHAMLFKACEGLTGVSVSDIAVEAKLSFYDGMTTKEIHGALIKAAADLISDHAVNYQYVAGNLLNYDLRKTAWGGMIQPRLYDHVKKMVADNYYTEELLEFYTEEDFDKMDVFIDHDRDFNMVYIGLIEYITKYAIRDRSLTESFPLETPQFTYMLIAAIAACKSKNLKEIKSFYNDFSLWNISLPTPIMAGVRSPDKQFSSCTLISAGDNIASITEASAAIVKYAANKAGIGIDASRIRAEGDVVKKSKSTKHTGVIPFLKSFEGALKSSAQGAIRGASASCYLTLWHYEIMDLLVLKNNKGTQDSRVRKMDYCFQVNNYLYNRLIDGKDITLFSPSERETPGLYDAFFKDQKKFAELYELYEKSPNIRKKTIPAVELFLLLMTERKETGRIYIFNVDNVNNNSCFKIPITTSNLCAEITLPTTPMASYTQERIEVTIDELPDALNKLNNYIYLDRYLITPLTNGKLVIDITRDEATIALCTLAAINLGNIKNLDDLESICFNAVKLLDNILDYQEYMVPAAKRHTILYRPLGIGITNLAYYLAKNGLKYSDAGAYELVHDTMEAISFYCIKASVELAKTRGQCEGYSNTTWSDSILPIDRYNKNVDKIISPTYKLDWKWLREQLTNYGIRNATLTAGMPVESSSRISNSTSGVDPIRALITTKSNKEHTTKQIVPEYNRLKNKYDMLWDMNSMSGFIKMMAIIQKFTCQSISTNTSYNPSLYKNNEIPMSTLIEDLLKCNYYGLKTLYYMNTRDGADDSIKNDTLSEPVKSQKEQENTEEQIEYEACDSCTI